MELHCSQTGSADWNNTVEFETPMELHCSQTKGNSFLTALVFETPMELHCSQTEYAAEDEHKRLRPLWNYTALKHHITHSTKTGSLRPLWNYTALKRGCVVGMGGEV